MTRMLRYFIVALVFCQLFSISALASWAHVQSDKISAEASSTTIALAYPSNVASGNNLKAAIAWQANSGQTISGCSDSLSQTWTQVGSTVTVTSIGGDWRLAVFRFYNTTGGANTLTCTFSAASFYRALAVGEYSGLATSNALDQTTGNPQVDPGTATDAVTSTSVTTTANNELIYGAALSVCGTSATVASGTGYTSRAFTFSGTFLCLRVEDKNLASAGSVAATFTAGDATEDTAAIIATFKEPGGAGGSSGGSMMLRGVGK